MVILGTDEAVAAKDRLYRALDKALEHKEALETHLAKRWKDLFGARCDLLLYDLTSTYFECASPRYFVGTGLVQGQNISWDLARGPRINVT